jgi:hypothetical protein
MVDDQLVDSKEVDPGSVAAHDLSEGPRSGREKDLLIAAQLPVRSVLEATDHLRYDLLQDRAPGGKTEKELANLGKMAHASSPVEPLVVLNLDQGLVQMVRHAAERLRNLAVQVQIEAPVPEQDQVAPEVGPLHHGLQGLIDREIARERITDEARHFVIIDQDVLESVLDAKVPQTGHERLHILGQSSLVAPGLKDGSRNYQPRSHNEGV